VLSGSWFTIGLSCVALSWANTTPAGTARHNTTNRSNVFMDPSFTIIYAQPAQMFRPIRHIFSSRHGFSCAKTDTRQRDSAAGAVQGNSRLVGAIGNGPTTGNLGQFGSSSRVVGRQRWTPPPHRRRLVKAGQKPHPENRTVRHSAEEAEKDDFEKARDISDQHRPSPSTNFSKNLRAMFMDCQRTRFHFAAIRDKSA
jgi:hypothetical protein